MSNPDTEGQSFPTEFVPVSRILIEEFSYQVAYLWGVIWQYCHMEDGICKASHQTIADRADISRRSVISYLDTLIEAGYIEDLTPDVRNEPHRYCVKKGVQILHTKEQQRKAEREKSKRPAVQDGPDRYAEDAQQNSKGVQELPTESERYAEIAQPGVQNLHKNRPSLIDSTDSPKGASPPKATAKSRASPPPPSVEVYRSKTNLFPRKNLWPMIAEAVGEMTENLDRWGDVVLKWVACGWNPRNIQGMLEFYKRGDTPTTSKNGAHKNGSKPKQKTDHRPEFEKRDKPPDPDEWASMLKSVA